MIYVGKGRAGGVEGTEQQQMALGRDLSEVIRICYLKTNQNNTWRGARVVVLQIFEGKNSGIEIM